MFATVTSYVGIGTAQLSADSESTGDGFLFHGIAIGERDVTHGSSGRVKFWPTDNRITVSEFKTSEQLLREEAPGMISAVGRLPKKCVTDLYKCIEMSHRYWAIKTDMQLPQRGNTLQGEGKLYCRSEDFPQFFLKGVDCSSEIHFKQLKRNDELELVLDVSPCLTESLHYVLL